MKLTPSTVLLVGDTDYNKSFQTLALIAARAPKSHALIVKEFGEDGTASWTADVRSPGTYDKEVEEADAVNGYRVRVAAVDGGFSKSFTTPEKALAYVTANFPEDGCVSTDGIARLDGIYAKVLSRSEPMSLAQLRGLCSHRANAS
jgi:hypothetical protein